MNASEQYMMEVLQGGDSLQSFELEHLTAALNRDKTLSAPMRNILQQKLTSIVQGGIHNGSIKTAQGVGQYNGGNMAQVSGQVAEFSLIATRNSSKIRKFLPIIFGMSDFLSNQYKQVVSNFIQQFAPGITLSSVTVVTGTILRFTYTDGVNTDQIDISCDTSPYPSWLSALNTTWLKTVMLRMELNNLTTPGSTDSDAGRQFKTVITPIFDTNFGAFGGNRSPLTNCKPPNQFQKNVIDIPWAKYPLSPREGWCLPVVFAGGSDADVLEVAIGHPVQEYTRSSSGK